MTANLLQHTPAWVWILLAALVALGRAQAVPRRMTLLRGAAMPGAMAVVSLVGTLGFFPGQPGALAAWSAGAAAALVLCNMAGAWGGIRREDAARRLYVPGSWVPLGLILCMFAMRFGLGAGHAMHAAWLADPRAALAAGFASGAVSGIFLARGLAMWRAARQTPAAGVIG
ncbi:DUF6622 family protein [Cupriavidus sp. 2TAF22]|uniref:DUF6622 family protein n=1 Tax=unclassified Cupriavidus TaxID=2640874 RepID=UPI003F90F9CE